MTIPGLPNREENFYVNGVLQKPTAPRGRIYSRRTDPKTGQSYRPGDPIPGQANTGNALWDNALNQQNEAKAANEGRYNQILTGIDDLRGRVLGDSGYINNMSLQERKDLEQQSKEEGTQAMQGVIRGGLGATTAVGSVMGGVKRRRAAAIGRLDDHLTNMRTSADMSITGDKNGVIERRTDAYPDISQLVQLSMAQGQGDGGGDFGGGGGGFGGAPMIGGSAYGGFGSAGATYAMPGMAWGGGASAPRQGPSPQLLDQMAKRRAAGQVNNANAVSQAMSGANARSFANQQASNPNSIFNDQAWQGFVNRRRQQLSLPSYANN